MRFCRAEMPSYCVKALENTQSILCGLFLVCEHFCSGRTASHRTALDFRGIFVLLDAGGLSPAKGEKGKKAPKRTGCPTHGFPARRWLIFRPIRRRRKWLKLYLRLRANSARLFRQSEARRPCQYMVGGRFRSMYQRFSNRSAPFVRSQRRKNAAASASTSVSSAIYASPEILPCSTSIYGKTRITGAAHPAKAGQG